jgi:ABC-2 type transport system permease protein
MSTIFGSGAMQNIDIGVVDEEFTATSRSIIRTIDSSPTLAVTHHFASSTDALAAIKRREIYGYFVLPHNLTRNLTQGSQTTIPYYFHYAFMSVGAQVESTLRTLLTIVSIDPIVVTANEMGVSESVVESFLEPTTSDIHPIGNASLNYGTYLTEPFFFIMFQIVMLITMVYVLGTESSHGKEWLTIAEDNIVTAMAGKSAPYVCSFVASGMAALSIMSRMGNLTLSLGLVGAMVGLVVASISLAIFLYSLYPHMTLILSLVSMIGSLGATLSGVTFPINSMYPIFRHVAPLLPIRHFTIITQNMLYTEGGYEAVWEHVVVLVAFCLLPLITATRLRKSIISGSYEKSK